MQWLTGDPCVCKYKFFYYFYVINARFIYLFVVIRNCDSGYINSNVVMIAV